MLRINCSHYSWFILLTVNKTIAKQDVSPTFLVFLSVQGPTPIQLFTTWYLSWFYTEWLGTAIQKARNLCICFAFANISLKECWESWNQLHAHQNKSIYSNWNIPMFTNLCLLLNRREFKETSNVNYLHWTVSWLVSHVINVCEMCYRHNSLVVSK